MIIIVHSIPQIEEYFKPVHFFGRGPHSWSKFPGQVVTLDIKAAFDWVWHKRLLAKLKARGISCNFLKYIISYLSTRKIQVVVGGWSSSEKPINASVLQGSILGPTLFLTYIDDLGDDLDNAIILYRDDRPDGTASC